MLSARRKSGASVPPTSSATAFNKRHSEEKDYSDGVIQSKKSKSSKSTKQERHPDNSKIKSSKSPYYRKSTASFNNPPTLESHNEPQFARVGTARSLGPALNTHAAVPPLAVSAETGALPGAFLQPIRKRVPQDE